MGQQANFQPGSEQGGAARPLSGVMGFDKEGMMQQYTSLTQKIKI
jgi:hypothetical protein